jgi:hypothetical protein
MAEPGSPSTVEGEVEVTVVAKGSALEPEPVDKKPACKPVKSKKSKWDSAELYRDAEWFAANFNLPNEGIEPQKIVDISEKYLGQCFGVWSKNGYKLWNHEQIPVDVILSLTQVVDGFDKPINGVLSHTFVKGIYTDYLLKQKVNWAYYAATKLKGQVIQWHRDDKPKPDGQPCVRKPQMYKAPAESSFHYKVIVEF